jgi:hypothetical protein
MDEGLATLQRTADLLNKQLGWKTAVKDILEIAVKYKDRLPSEFISELVYYDQRKLPLA